MAKLSPGDALALWFSYLRGFQSACGFNTNVPAMNLLAFANSQISTILPSANEQQQFIVAAQQNPGFDISVADLTANKTFEALLDKFNPLITYVGAYLETFAAAPFPGGALADFFQAPTTTAFPGGGTGAQWKTANDRLASIIPSVCYTSTLQTKVAQTMDTANKLMSDVIGQIAVLG